MFTEEHILKEVGKIQYLYGLKQEIRYAQTRTLNTESVAEHIYGMHICAQYFLPLEDIEGSWDTTRIYEMITLHDIDEIETGDVIGYTKTDAIRKAEADAMREVIQKSPQHMQNAIAELIEEYEAQMSKESLFVKAIDKIDVQFQVYNANGKQVLLSNETTQRQHRSIKDAYMIGFPYIQAFNSTISDAMQREGFFTDEA